MGLKSMWDLYLELREIEEETDRLVMRKSKERDITERNRLDKEIDRLLAKYLEVKHKLEKIEI